MAPMAKATPTFKEILEAAAKPYAKLWNNGKLSPNALAKFYQDKKCKVSSASFSRILAGKQDIGESVIDATSSVFRISKSMLRGEPLTADMERSLSESRLSTLFLARRIEDLPREDYDMIVKALERAEQNAEKLRDALQSGGVVSIDRARKS